MNSPVIIDNTESLAAEHRSMRELFMPVQRVVGLLQHGLMNSIHYFDGMLFNREVLRKSYTKAHTHVYSHNRHKAYHYIPQRVWRRHSALLNELIEQQDDCRKHNRVVQADNGQSEFL